MTGKTKTKYPDVYIITFCSNLTIEKQCKTLFFQGHNIFSHSKFTVTHNEAWRSHVTMLTFMQV